MVIDIAAAALPNLGAVYPKMLSAVGEPWASTDRSKKKPRRSCSQCSNCRGPLAPNDVNSSVFAILTTDLCPRDTQVGTHIDQDCFGGTR
jgi:hypothetical protein